MNATGRTVVFVVVAAAAFGASMGVQFLTQPTVVEGFSEVGQEFFPDFEDPLKARELNVTRYDDASSEVQSFTVKQNDEGLWLIPSHHNYPAEAAERLAKTAASMIGIRKVAIQSRSDVDWARYGVADPSAEVVAELDKEDEKDPRGTRVSLRDSSGNALVDLIIGYPVEGREKHFYVRQPDKNPVFIAKVDANLSAKFSDWIEPDLLKLNPADIVRIKADRYSIDEANQTILVGDVLELGKDSEQNKWAMTGLNPEQESLNDSVISDLTRNLDQLKIVGVRPKPPGINADLTITREVAESALLQDALQVEMRRQGFYIFPDDQQKLRLWSNEGELIAGTADGVLYTLYFGEIARGSAKDIETGLVDTKTTDAKPGETTPGDAETPKDSMADALKEIQAAAEEEAVGPRRYLLVKAEYDESLLGPKPTEPVEPTKPAILDETTPAEKPAGAQPSDAPPAATPDAVPGDAPPAIETPEVKPADVPVEKPSGEAPSGEAPSGEAPAGEAPAGEAPAGEAPSGDPGSCDEVTPNDAEPTPVQESQEAPATQDPPVETPAVVSPTEVPAETTQEPAPAQDPVPAATEEATPTEAAKPGDETATSTVPAEQETPTQETAAPAQPPVDPKVAAEQQYQQAMLEYKSAKAAYERNLKAWNDRATDGQKKARELKTRFEGWYYVISAESFEKFALSRELLVGPKEASPAPPTAPGLPGAPGIPGFDLPGVN